MLHQLNTNTLASFDAESRKSELDELVGQTKIANGSSSAYLIAKIRGYERQFQMGSDEMASRLSRGDLEETEEIAAWLFYLDAYRAHAG